MTLLYTGKKLQKEVSLRKTSKYAADTLYPYLPDPGLVNAVNLAITLERPLLLMGEPGSGKSRLASALAHELYHGRTIGDKKQDYRDWLFEWSIKSTTKAKDGLYEYDALGRLLAAQSKDPKAKNVGNFIDDRAMALAFKKSTKDDRRAVLLIDEVDKADLDFPNDLLNELDRGFFTIPETNKTLVAEKMPIIIITSNRERELPEAFLRRCVYHFIKPFSAERLKEILVARYYPGQLPATKKLLEKAVRVFENIRNRIQTEKLPGKNISTSELIDWYKVLNQYHALMEIPDALTDDQKAAYANIFEELKKFIATDEDTGLVPLHQTLFKNIEIVDVFLKDDHTTAS